MVNENCPKKFVVSSGVCLLQVHQAGCRSSILPSKALPFADLLIKPTNHEQGIITAEPAAESKALWGRIQTRITVCFYRYGPRLWGSPTTKQHPSIYPCSFCFHKSHWPASSRWTKAVGQVCHLRAMLSRQLVEPHLHHLHQIVDLAQLCQFRDQSMDHPMQERLGECHLEQAMKQYVLRQLCSSKFLF